MSRTFLRLQTDAKLPRLTLHGLRHSFATVGLLAGIDTKLVSEVLGHANTSITADLYQHVTPGQKADAMNTIADLIGGSR